MVRCSCKIYTDTWKKYNSGCLLYPRSSNATKTPLRLANSVGVIDSGYMDNIRAVFDIIDDKDYSIHYGDRLVQVCSGGLYPIYVVIVDNEDELRDGETTFREYGGFGSTGK